MTAFNQDFDLEGKSPAELEQRRREIVSALSGQVYQGYDDPQVPEALLRQLAHITGALRRRTSGPPKVAKPSKAPGPKPTLDDLVI